MEIREFEGNDTNIENLARHNVSPDEVEDVALEDIPWIKKGRKGIRYMLGFTVGGRFLLIVYRSKNIGNARVITAKDSPYIRYQLAKSIEAEKLR